MKKFLLSITFLLCLSNSHSQNQFAFGFDGTTAAMYASGWEETNLSNPVGGSVWTIPAAAPTTTFAGGGQAGGATSFALVNFNSIAAASAGTISNWLISPSIDVQNGDIVTFYTRLGRNVAAGGEASFPDNLELRMSSDGANTIPSTDENDLGSFTNLLVEVNPSLDTTSYPLTWTVKTATVSGLAGITTVRFAFRYYVLDGGPNGANSDIIGIDTFSVDRPLSTDSFFAQNFSVYPNPATSVLNIAVKNNVAISQAQITDINGRVVKSVNNVVSQINISDLNTGVYFLKITTDQGVGTTKIVKN
jgi:hypothetical protein